MQLLSVILVAAVVGSAIGGALAYVEVRPGAGLVRLPTPPAGTAVRADRNGPNF